jgi:cytochrome P450 PksS
MCEIPRPTYELTNPHVLAEPHALFHRMRREDPVHWSDAIEAWVLTRHDDVLAALREPRLSSARTEAIAAYQLRDADPAIAADWVRVTRGSMLMKDGADHHRLRVLGNHGFTPSMMDRARPKIQKVVDELLDAVIGRGPFDIVRDLSQPLPAIVISELFGIPPRDRDLFQRWSDDGAKFGGGTLGDAEHDARTANRSTLEMEQYFAALLDERRKKPGDDLMSMLIRGQDEGKLSAAEVACQCMLFLVAGHVTTIDQLANTVHALLTHPDQWRKLRGDPRLVKSAVEEALRYDGAVPFINRFAAADLEIRGKTIRAGQMVYLCIAAANRDPEVFFEPDAFDVTRESNRHIAFGVGPHVCIGAGLARRELESALGALVRRMPTLHLVDGEAPMRRCESLAFRGFHRLPAAF